MIKKIIKRINKYWKNKEIKKRLIFTVFIFTIYRFLAHIPIFIVDTEKLKYIFASNDLLNLINIFTGGTLIQSSIVAVGVNPYITASIIIQLAGFVIPKIKELQKEGESGYAVLNQYMRFISIPIAALQASSILVLLKTQGILKRTDPLSMITTILVLVAGAMISMWLGDLISEKGVGNGVSILMFVGIVSQLPRLFYQTISINPQDKFFSSLIFFTLFFIVISLIVFVDQAVRKIPIQYARRTKAGVVYGGQRSHLPIKVNTAGVMPIVFAVSLMMVPAFISRLLINSSNPKLVSIGETLMSLFSQTSLFYIVLYFILVFSFTFFSSIVFFNAEDVADSLKKSGAFIKGIRPGKATQVYLEGVVIRITFAGGLFLGFIAILPILAQIFTSIGSLAVSGTGILIMVSVIMDTLKQLDGMAINEDYDKYINI